jgi:hypothetical protein
MYFEPDMQDHENVLEQITAASLLDVWVYIAALPGRASHW